MTGRYNNADLATVTADVWIILYSTRQIIIVFNPLAKGSSGGILFNRNDVCIC